ncbi:MAG: HigA family addiction module antidote protein [Lachnospiraceae bacterium]|nr:HigA family addiction module antidote protein [Lachnospiraceae bacterium]MBR0153158.1 HigA family addiction module antidote protein [Lachnospiraceae bacterium]
MSDYIETPKLSEILWEEFMEPNQISAYRLAKDVGVPVSRIQDLLHDRRKMTADTSVRLGVYFGVSDNYFLNIQNDIDIRNVRIAHKDELQRIQPLG